MTTWSDFAFDPPGQDAPREHVTEISVPESGDGRQALYAPGSAKPEPEAAR
jgi:hypothetical protein